MKRNGLWNLAVAGLLVAAMMAAMSMPAEASQDLRVTDENLATLRSFTYINPATWDGISPWYAYGVGNTPRMLKYDYGVKLNTYGGSKTAVYIGSMKAIKIRDGECVKFANALANRNGMSASDWNRGKRVMDGGVAPGTLVATFMSNGRYDTFGTITGNNHVAIFDSYILLSGPGIEKRIVGFRVWDSNFVAPYVAGMHNLYQSTYYKSNAYNYYVVQGP